MIERLGPNSIPFMMDILREIPASVQLLPAKKYTGSPIGTSYDVRIYATDCNEGNDGRIQKRSSVKLGIKLLHKLSLESIVNHNEFNQTKEQLTVPRLHLKLSPKGRKLIKHTSLIIRGEYKNTNYNACKSMSQLSVSENNIRSIKASRIYILKF